MRDHREAGGWKARQAPCPGEFFLVHRRDLMEELGARGRLSEPLERSTGLSVGAPPSRPHHLPEARLQMPALAVWFQQVNLGGHRPSAHSVQSYV